MRRSLLVIAISFALTTAIGCSRTETVRADANETDEVTVVAELPSDTEATVAEGEVLDRIEVTGSRLQREEAAKLSADGPASGRTNEAYRMAPVSPPPMPVTAPAHLGYAQPLQQRQAGDINYENYEDIEDNRIVRTAEQPVSTFSIDVDTGSYSNVRRMLAQGSLPPADAVRVEEMINYFDYDYPSPTSREQPFRVTTEVAPAPWNSERLLLQVGIQGYDVQRAEIPPANLVFLIDTSGSMADENKLPLLKAAFAQLVENLREQDRISMVVYAGSAGLVLPPTSGADKETILAALSQLDAGGSTNGGEGIALAYAQAREAFMANGVNRVILATDGDFNVGVVDPTALETMVAEQRQAGIALTTLGFGQGNYNDAMAEKLADVGDGNHAYIDNLLEARKVLVEEMSSTLLTIAKDVKIQVEFNPAVVAEYRLIGYENRMLNREDFNNDQVDAGEIGAGHDVTALYEITLVGSRGQANDPLRYGPASPRTAHGDEIALLRLRYKQPNADSSRLIETPIQRRQIQAQAGERLRFAAAVAAYADRLRGGENIGRFTWADIEALARSGAGQDRWGYRNEFLQLIARARSLSADQAPTPVAAINE